MNKTNKAKKIVAKIGALPLKAAAKKATPMAKSLKKPEPKVKLEVLPTKKGEKKSDKLEVIAVEALEVQVTEEEEDEMEGAEASSGRASQAGLAMAAATADTASGSLKNFRHHPDIENFYRFIYENDLRYEALEIIDRMSAQGLVQKTMKAARARPN